MDDVVKTYKSNLDTITAEYDTIKKKFMTQLQSTMKESFAEFFAAYPEVYGITWTQYTPHFNDGDSCEFSVHDFWHIAQKELYEDENDFDDAVSDSYPEEYQHFIKPSQYAIEHVAKNGDASYYLVEVTRWNNADSRFKEVCDGVEAFTKQLSNVPSEIFEAMFGDHVKIMATVNGFDVDEYDHD